MKVENDENTRDTRVIGSSLREDNNSTSYVLMYYDSLGPRPPIPLLFYAKGVGFIRKIQIDYNLSDRDSISIYLFYKIYL
jgi:hypothetical protein